MAHIHSVYDTDSHFSINPITRQFKNEGSTKAKVSQFDHNSERFTFEIPRYIADGHDMSLCNSVQVHFLNVNPQTKEKREGFYVVDDLQISPEDEGIVICSWLIAKSATQLEGKLNFLIRFSCVADDGTIEFVWNTAIHTDIAVSSGIYNGDADDEEYIDILKQWEIGFNNRLDAVVSYEAQNVTDEQKEQARENIGAASKEDLEGLNFMPPQGNPEAEVRFDVAHAQMVTAPEFVIADPESSSESILLTKEGAEDDGEQRKAVMLTDPYENPVILSNLADPEKDTDAANKGYVKGKVDGLSRYLEDLVYKETIQVSGAKVGQFLKVSAVDENGVPAAWEVAEPPVAPFRLLQEVIIPSDITTDMSGVSFIQAQDGTGVVFEFDTDSENNPFNVRELYIVANVHNTSTSRAYMAELFPNGKSQSFALSVILGSFGNGGSPGNDWSYAYLQLLKGHFISYGWMYGGGGTAPVNGRTLNTKTDVYGYDVFDEGIYRIKLQVDNTTRTGFSPGSTFAFYGR